MSESLYRRKPLDAAISVLKGRSNLLKPNSGTNTPVQTHGGKSAQVRNPVYIKITGRDRRCNGDSTSYTLPRNLETWDSVYVTHKTLKPPPDVESVTIEYGGDWGLAQKVSATIKCYKVEDFNIVQRYFLVPGNEIDVSFGHSSNVTWGIPQTGKLKGFVVATFSFTSGQSGIWTCNFEAVSSAVAIKNLDMQITVCNGCNAQAGNGQGKDDGPIKYMTGQEKTRHPVKGIAQLIAADAQWNGLTAIDDMRDGEVITNFVNFNPGTTYGKDAAIVLYTGDHLRNLVGKFDAWVGGVLKDLGFGKSEVEYANNQVYISLGYIVHRLIDDQLLRAMSCGIVENSNAQDRSRFNKLKVEFHPKYSKSKVPDGITSGDPTTVLLLGKGNYLNKNKVGKDFDGDCQDLGAIRAISGGDVRLQNILVHRDVVVGAFNKATTQRESDSDNTDVKSTKEEIVNVVDFFDAIADHISSCLGGAISLRLVEDPDDSNKLIVVDQNYGVSAEIPCIVFNPIDGDGSTRACEIQSNVGSQEYRVGMYAGASKKGDSVSNIRGCSQELKDQRSKELQKAKLDIDALIKDPGNLGENEFDSQEINALKSAMGRLYRSNQNAENLETLHWPGLSISVTLDGVWGIIPGCAISTTQIPQSWRETNKSYFMVTKVTHNFQNSDWSTQLEGILSYYKSLTWVKL